MTSKNKIAAAVILAALVSAGAASAQIYATPYGQPPPLYPYAVQPQPNVYVVPPYGAPQANPYTRSRPAPKVRNRGLIRTDPVLVEELRTNPRYRKHVVNKKIVVRGPPIVVETKKYVDDPPNVIERYHYVDDDPPKTKPKKKRHKHATVAIDNEPVKRKKRGEPAEPKTRVIRAEAEVTIIGPDRMNIRLFRKQRGTDANASASAD